MVASKALPPCFMIAAPTILASGCALETLALLNVPDFTTLYWYGLTSFVGPTIAFSYCPIAPRYRQNKRTVKIVDFMVENYSIFG
jgi:hypothetical protein